MLLEQTFVDEVYVERRTTDLKNRLRTARMRWLDFLKDPRKEARLAAQECLDCFYGSHIAGAAMCSRACADCSSIVHSGSTRCPILCKPCAKKRKLCCMCGARISTKPRK
jgi:hypothetical protein